MIFTKFIFILFIIVGVFLVPMFAICEGMTSNEYKRVLRHKELVHQHTTDGNHRHEFNYKDYKEVNGEKGHGNITTYLGIGPVDYSYEWKGEGGADINDHTHEIGVIGRGNETQYYDWKTNWNENSDAVTTNENETETDKSGWFY